MNFSAGNHPCKTFLANQDEFLRRKSSLSNTSSKSGCISPPEIISAKHFLQIRMNFPAGIHPCQTFPPNQDESLHRKSSLPNASSKSGCIPPQKASWQSCAPQAHVSTSTNKPPVSTSANKPQPQLLPASSASISALTASTIPESSRMRSLSMRLMGTEMENAYRDPPSSESAAAMQRTPASFSSLSSA